MDKSVAEGVRAVRGLEAELRYYVDPVVLSRFDAIGVGMPTYHHDMTLDMRELFEEATVKNVGLKENLVQPSALMAGAGRH